MFNIIRSCRSFVAAALLTGGLASTASAQNAAAPHPAFENFNIGENGYVRALAVDPKRNAVWVGTSGGAMEIDLATQNVRNTFTRKDGLANEYVFALGVDQKNGKTWFGTNSGGASTWDGSKWKTYFPMHGLADYWVYSFAFDKQGGTWIGTWDGANYIDPAGKMKTIRNELVNIWVYGLDIDDKGRVWFGTEGGVSMFDGAKWQSWTHEDGLGAENIKDLPRSPNTGLGTRQRKDLTVEASGAETYNPNYVFATLADRTGRGTWFGTWGAGASLYDGAKFKNFTTADGLPGNIIYSLAQDKDGGVWFGTNRGVSYYDGKTFSNYGRAHGLIGDHVYAIAIAPDGSVWFGSKGGVSRLAKRN